MKSEKEVRKQKKEWEKKWHMAETSEVLLFWSHRVHALEWVLGD